MLDKCATRIVVVAVDAIEIAARWKFMEDNRRYKSGDR
jgi:hypothetical protein